MPRTRARRTKSRAPRRLTIRAELRQLRALIDRRFEVIEALQRASEIQFRRIAQLQAEIDQVKRRDPAANGSRTRVSD